MFHLARAFWLFETSMKITSLGENYTWLVQVESLYGLLRPWGAPWLYRLLVYLFTVPTLVLALLCKTQMPHHVVLR